ncbi:cupin domain-containing protein [Natronococcus occultus]|uniref:Cupin domain-containing protein n=1 Tax=Natronococcus occultus SP4 TaxID=694430 RepID=L0K6K4_9EURY|nr:cupin domain-containing protein [Natronococcus occultus]AGB39994.1 cupin domain-containing protein [Natronococcus occultus SP4]
MNGGWTHTSLEDVATNPDKPGDRWETSPALGVEAFNFNVAVLDPDERLSQNHFHYHENQKELFYVVSGSCRARTVDETVTLETDELIAFDEGEGGAHVLYNPFEKPCKLVAVGWPQDGRYPVHQLERTETAVDDHADE